MVSTNVTKHPGHVDLEERARRLGQGGVVVWFTGLSGSGKSTIAYSAEDRLTDEGLTTCVLDGDNVRHGLCGDLGFSDADRAENLRRVGEVASLFYNAGVITLCSFVSPRRETRQELRRRFPDGAFVEIHVSTSLEVCERRDPKGLYRRARSGEIENFTGLSAPYEEPTDADLVIDTNEVSVGDAVERVCALIKSRVSPGL